MARGLFLFLGALVLELIQSQAPIDGAARCFRRLNENDRSDLILLMKSDLGFFEEEVARFRKLLLSVSWE